MKIETRRTYLADKTVGKILVDGKEIGNSIEDIGRPAGIKIPKETCIPEGEYQVTITHSTRFGKPMLLLFTDKKTLACTHEGVTFTGIRVHGGTTTAHTEGCILTSQTAQIQALVAAAIARNEPVTWTIGRA